MVPGAFSPVGVTVTYPKMPSMMQMKRKVSRMYSLSPMSCHDRRWSPSMRKRKKRMSASCSSAYSSADVSFPNSASMRNTDGEEDSAMTCPCVFPSPPPCDAGSSSFFSATTCSAVGAPPSFAAPSSTPSTCGSDE